jgi:hypothetical protein
LAALAEQETREQSVLGHTNCSCLGAATGTHLGIDFFPYQRLDDRLMLASVYRTPMFDLAGIDGVGKQPA